MASKGLFITLSIGASFARQTPTGSARPITDVTNTETWSPNISSYEGQLVRGDGTPRVYKIEDGRKRWIITEGVLLNRGYSWSQVNVVPRAIIDDVPCGPIIT